MSNDLEVIRVTTSKDGDEVVDADFVMEGCPFVCTYINSGFSNKKVVNRHPDLQKSGVYILWSTGSRIKAYVGQAGARETSSLGTRFLGHYNRPDNEDYRYDWNLHLSITRRDTDYGFSGDEITSLENRLNNLVISLADIVSLNTGGTSESKAIKPDSEASKLIDQAVEFIKLVVEKHFGGWLGKSVYSPNQNQNVITKSKYTNYKFYPDEIDDIVTPEWMVKQMVDLIPYEKFNPNSRFLDLAAKGGEFLKEVRNRLEEAPLMKEAFPVRKERIAYIEENMLYGVCITKVGYEDCLNNLEIKEESTKHILKGLTNSDFVGKYGIANYIDAVKGIQITVVEGGKAHYITIQQELSRKFSDNKELDMKFDVVIGNPPYKKDLYLDFVQTGYDVLKDDGVMVMITPAKGFQGLGELPVGYDNLTESEWKCLGEIDEYKNAYFRHKIMPRTAKLVYFRDTKDIFDIGEPDGICYYKVLKNIQNTTSIRLVSERCSAFNTNEESMHRNDNECWIMSDNMYSIVKKSGVNGYIDDKLSFKRQLYMAEKEEGHYVKDAEHYIEVCQGADNIGEAPKITGYLSKAELKTTAYIEKWKIIQSIKTQQGSSRAFDLSGKTLGGNMITILKPGQVPKGTFQQLAVFETEESARRCQKFLMSKLCSFLEFIGIVGHTENHKFYRYVPNMPDKYTSEWTNEDIYKNYNLTDDEINIIESVIKERK